MKQASLKGLFFAISCLGAGGAWASAFQLLEQNGSGLANSYAGSAAVAEDASTIFFNPAGMTRLKSTSFSVGVVGIQTSYKFSNGNSATGALAATGTGDDAGGTGVVPNGYLAWALSNDVYLGLGIGAPFGLKTEYHNPWMGAAQSVKFDIKTVNVNPSVAWRVNEKLSLGFGLDWQKMDAEYVRVAGIIPFPVPLSSSQVRLKANDNAWGWNAGLFYQPTPDLRIGVSYRSRIDYKLHGNVAVTGPSALVNAGGSSNATAEVKVPDTLIFSAVRTLDEHWEVMGDLSWTGWSSIPKVDIVRTSGPLSGATAQTLGTNFKNTWRVAGGINYALDATTKLKFGAAFDKTPIPDADHRLVSLPDNNRFWISGGAQWKMGQNGALDLGLAYLYLKDSKIHNNQGASLGTPLRGIVDGSYKASAWLLGTEYSMSF